MRVESEAAPAGRRLHRDRDHDRRSVSRAERRATGPSTGRASRTATSSASRACTCAVPGGASGHETDKVSPQLARERRAPRQGDERRRRRRRAGLLRDGQRRRGLLGRLDRLAQRDPGRRCVSRITANVLERFLVVGFYAAMARLHANHPARSDPGSRAAQGRHGHEDGPRRSSHVGLRHRPGAHRRRASSGWARRRSRRSGAARRARAASPRSTT